jgi:hypothetical protein
LTNSRVYHILIFIPANKVNYLLSRDIVACVYNTFNMKYAFQVVTICNDKKINHCIILFNKRVGLKCYERKHMLTRIYIRRQIHVPVHTIRYCTGKGTYLALYMFPKINNAWLLILMCCQRTVKYI